MDLASIDMIPSTDGQTDGQIDRQGETIIPPFNFFGRGRGMGGRV